MSSNLILPQSYVNETLEKNLKIFFQRYPHEKARLDKLLRTPVPLERVLPKVEQIPSPPKQPPARVMIMLGINNPMMIAELINHPEVIKETFKLFIIENDAEFIAWCFQHADLTQVIAFSKTEWFICHTADSFRPAMFQALRPEGTTSMMMNAVFFQLEIPQSQEATLFYAKVESLYKETAFHVMHNHGNAKDSLRGIEFTLKNEKFLLDKPGIEDLENYYRGETALIVGTGPSLDYDIETIKKYNNRFVVIAADASLKPLLKAGIRVDYVTSIERDDIFQLPFFQGIEGKVDAELIAFPVVHPDVLSVYPGNIRLVYRNYAFYPYFEKSWPKQILKCGGSTSHLGVRLAAFMGCSKILLTGMDSCYEEKDGMFRSHAANTGYPDWAEFTTLEQYQTDYRKHAPAFTAVGNTLPTVTTNTTYFQWAKEYSEELATLGQQILIKNCSVKGIRMEGIPFIPLEEAVSSMPQMFLEKAPFPARVLYNRTWDHGVLINNLKGFLNLARDGITQSQEMLAKPEISMEDYQGLFYIYNGRLIMDELFVAFVVQVCAKTFFELENKWWSYEIEPTADLKGKTETIMMKLQAFEEVLVDLIQMFEGGENGN